MSGRLNEWPRVDLWPGAAVTRRVPASSSAGTRSCCRWPDARSARCPPRMCSSRLCTRQSSLPDPPVSPPCPRSSWALQCVIWEKEGKARNWSLWYAANLLSVCVVSTVSHNGGQDVRMFDLLRSGDFLGSGQTGQTLLKYAAVHRCRNQLHCPHFSVRSEFWEKEKPLLSRLPQSVVLFHRWTHQGQCSVCLNHLGGRATQCHFFFMLFKGSQQYSLAHQG